jgi:hypothetical protein
MSERRRNTVTHIAQRDISPFLTQIFQRNEDGTIKSWVDDSSHGRIKSSPDREHQSDTLPEDITWKENLLYQPPTE